MDDLLANGWGEPEANTPDGRVPDTWIDDEGVRHIRFTDLDEQPLNYLSEAKVWVTKAPF